MTGWQIGAAATIAGGLALAAAGLVAERYLEARDASELAMRDILSCFDPRPQAERSQLADTIRDLACERILTSCDRAAEVGRPVEACAWFRRP